MSGVTGLTARRRGERGAATAFTAALAGLLVFVGLVAATVMGLFVGERRAASAADLAALAGAQALQEGGDACAAAHRSVQANAGRLSVCGVAGGGVEVRVDLEVTSPLTWSWTVSSRARAGPEPAPAGLHPLG